MDLVHLVELIVAREQREECEHLEHDAADAPVVHLVAVVAVGHQAFGRPVPASRDVLSEGRLRVDPTAGAEVRKLNLLVLDEDVFAASIEAKRVLRLDVSVEDAVLVHVVDRLEDLVHVELHALLR